MSLLVSWRRESDMIAVVGGLVLVMNVWFEVVE